MFYDLFDFQYLLTPIAVVSRRRYANVMKTHYVDYRTLHIFGLRVARWT